MTHRIGRDRLVELVRVAQSVRAPVMPDPPVNGAARDAALRELRAWYKDWSETARAVIRRRDLLVLMGLAHRRAPKRQEAPQPAPVPTAPPAPAPAPVHVDSSTAVG